MDLRGRSLGSVDGLLPVAASPSASSLDLRDNRLCDLGSLGAWPGLGQLRELHLGRNRVVSLASLRAPVLDYLGVEDNFVTERQLAAGPEDGLPLLRHLRLSGNSLSGFHPAATLALLCVLDLRGNTLSALVRGAHDDAFRLRVAIVFGIPFLAKGATSWGNRRRKQSHICIQRGPEHL